MKQGGFPPGWDTERVKRVLAYYESQSEEEAVAEDEAAFEAAGQTVIEVPSEIVPAIRELIAKYKAA
jgi:type II secretory pathway component PulC